MSSNEKTQNYKVVDLIESWELQLWYKKYIYWIPYKKYINFLMW
jgi:hypothetical protein